MADLKETEYWVYRKDDHSLVGTLDVFELEDEFMDVNVLVCSGKLTHAQTPELDRLHTGEWILKRPGKEEHFGDFTTHEAVREAVKNAPAGPYFLSEQPIFAVED